MLSYYLKTVIRIFRGKRLYFFINIIGLAVGLSAFILIILWINDEFSYEDMHRNAKNVYLLHKQYKMGERIETNSSLPWPLGPSLVAELPEISYAVRVVRHFPVVHNGVDYYSEDKVCAADPNYFSLFSFQFLEGDPAEALKDPYSIVLTKEKAEKYFGQEPALGKDLWLDKQDPYTVTGIIEDITENTYLDYDLIIPFETIYSSAEYSDEWYNHFIQTYILLPPNIDISSFQQKLTRHIRNYMTEDTTVELLPQRLDRMHLFNLDTRNQRIQYVYIFSLIGFLIILIACINYINVSTSLSIKRSHEIGVKKAIGAKRKQLFLQFIGETFIQTLIAFLIASVLVELIRPSFNQLTGKEIQLPFLDPWFIVFLICLLVITTFLSGIYPALLLSSFKPVSVFQGKIVTGKGRQAFRVGLVIVQFTISISLIISSLLINGQLKYIHNKDLGFEKENVLYIPIVSDFATKYDVFRTALLDNPGIMNVCRCSNTPSSFWGIVRGVEWEGKPDEGTESFAFASVDYDFIETIGLELTHGRNFSRNYALDSGSIIINQKAFDHMGLDDLEGKKILFDSVGNDIIGVVKNFNSLPLTHDIEPMLMLMWPEYYFVMMIRLSPGNLDEIIPYIETTWKQLAPDIPFEYHFLDEKIERQYQNETRMAKLSGWFTLLAILITCIGLFGISAHTAQQKTKEIGVRKVFGASAEIIVKRFLFIFLKWVIISSVIAWPVSWYFIKNWLENFAFRIPITIWVFVLSSLIGITIALITVSYQSLVAANKNPVDTLRYE
jgi:putative ABC transport system permease protein